MRKTFLKWIETHGFSGCYFRTCKRSEMEKTLWNPYRNCVAFTGFLCFLCFSCSDQNLSYVWLFVVFPPFLCFYLCSLVVHCPLFFLLWPSFGYVCVWSFKWCVFGILMICFFSFYVFNFLMFSHLCLCFILWSFPKSWGIPNHPSHERP